MCIMFWLYGFVVVVFVLVGVFLVLVVEFVGFLDYWFCFGIIVIKNLERWFYLVF